MAEDKWIIFSCIEITQPIGTFYIGVVNCADLLRISFADRRVIREESEKLRLFPASSVSYPTNVLESFENT